MVKDLTEIIGAINNLVKECEIDTLLTQKQSISKAAMDGIANFPVCVEDSLTVDEGMMISRALEKRFASFLMVVMSMRPHFDTTKGDMTDYIKTFHQNMESIDLTELPFVCESDAVKNFLNITEKMGTEYVPFVHEATNALCMIYEGVNSKYANLETSKLNFSIETVTNHSTLNNIGRIVLEADGKKFDPKLREPIVNQKFDKANDVVPTLLHVRVFPKGGTQTDPIDFVIGVKATLHPIKQQDILINLVRGLKNENKFFNFIRWTTGEIKFFKDFLFGVDQMKLDAVASSNSSASMFNMGKRRKSLSVLKNYFTKENLLPNMTLVVTTDCLNRLKDEYGYDIGMDAGSSQIALIKKMMSIYFLLGFVIVDPGLSRVNILVDGENRFESYTYSGLQKEGTVNDKQFKEMMRMLGRSV